MLIMTALEDAVFFARVVGLLLEGRDDAARSVLEMLTREDPIAAPVFDRNAGIDAGAIPSLSFTASIAV
jgi:hypothetical protein